MFQNPQDLDRFIRNPFKKFYQISTGDTLSSIAKMLGIDSGALTAANPGLYKLTPGLSIRVPAPSYRPTAPEGQLGTSAGYNLANRGGRAPKAPLPGTYTQGERTITRTNANYPSEARFAQTLGGATAKGEREKLYGKTTPAQFWEFTPDGGLRQLKRVLPNEAVTRWQEYNATSTKPITQAEFMTSSGYEYRVSGGQSVWVYVGQEAAQKAGQAAAGGATGYTRSVSPYTGVDYGIAPGEPGYMVGRSKTTGKQTDERWWLRGKKGGGKGKKGGGGGEEEVATTAAPAQPTTPQANNIVDVMSQWRIGE